MQPEINFCKVGARVRQLRVQRGLTQAELGARVECSNNHISHIESGQTKVSLTLLMKLAYAMDSSLDYFLLDTPYARRETLVNDELAAKLARCDRATLVAASKILDALLEQQQTYHTEYDLT